MNKEKQKNRRFILKYSKEAERSFFFYATLAMVILWFCLKIIGE